VDAPAYDRRGAARRDPRTWARRFAELEAPVSIRRRLGHERRISSDPQSVLMAVADPGGSVQERAGVREALRTIGDLIDNALTTRQRAVIVGGAINGIPTRTLASVLNTTPGAIYKTLHDARLRLRTGLAG
jgi:RNA polymerase sigma-70 factor (ECF subfamily)